MQSGTLLGPGYAGSILSPSFRGGTAVGELGLSYRQSDSLYFNLGAEGYLGKREGFSGNFGFGWHW